MHCKPREHTITTWSELALQASYNHQQSVSQLHNNTTAQNTYSRNSQQGPESLLRSRHQHRGHRGPVPLLQLQAPCLAGPKESQQLSRCLKLCAAIHTCCLDRCVASCLVDAAMLKPGWLALLLQHITVHHQPDDPCYSHVATPPPPLSHTTRQQTQLG